MQTELASALGSDRVQPLRPRPPFSKRAHLFEPEELDALQFAMDAERALLVTGEPGCGKTQLAEAAAELFGCSLHRVTVDSRTEARDLFFEIDYVRRLAVAQGILGKEIDPASLDAVKFVRPGPLWKALDPEGAKQCGLHDEDSDTETAKDGPQAVVLIDEIDKAEIDFPNALLDILASWSFRGPDGEPIHLSSKAETAPLVIVTSNAEKDLPGPFVRRCITHAIVVPEDGEEFRDYVRRRGEICFDLDPEVLEEAAADLEEDRRGARREGQPLPGVAEYLDMLRVLEKRADTTSERLALLRKARPFLFGKHKALR